MCGLRNVPASVCLVLESFSALDVIIFFIFVSEAQINNEQLVKGNGVR